MPIQRTYPLPSCTLVLEGISSGNADAIAIVTNFECRFHQSQSEFAGGRSLLDALARAVNRYVELVQAGDALPGKKSSEVLFAPIALEPISTFVHKLRVLPDPNDGTLKPVTIQFSTVELYDLQEGLDKICTDPQTLSDLSLEVVLQGAMRGAPKPEVKALPAVVGVVSLAVAGIAIALIPVPKPEPRPVLSPAASATKGTPKPSVRPSPLPPAIADASLIEKLQTDLRSVLDKAWRDPAKFASDRLYRVAVNAKGEIVGYKFAAPEDPEESSDDRLPLKKLLVVATDAETGGSPATPQPTITFYVSFGANDKLRVERKQERSDRLQKTLRDDIDRLWKTKPSFNEDQNYRVALNERGEVMSYEAIGAADAAAPELPLPELQAATKIKMDKPYPGATFQVTFRPSGTISVAPAGS